MPLPVADLFEVLTVLSDVLFVLDEFVVHLLDQVSTLETVNLVLYTHIEWSCNGTLLLIAVNCKVLFHRRKKGRTELLKCGKINRN